MSNPRVRKLPVGALVATPGWFDMNCLFGDPGYEYKEDRTSGSAVAAAGGFTGLAHLPNTRPVIASKNDIAYLTANNNSQVTDIHPIAAVTVNAEGKELTENDRFTSCRCYCIF